MPFVTFHDPEAGYGVSMTLGNEGSTFETFEFMVADQSCYQPAALEVELHRHWLHLSLPPGTIGAADGGEDVYEIHFRIDDEHHAALAKSLEYLLRRRGTVRILED